MYNYTERYRNEGTPLYRRWINRGGNGAVAVWIELCLFLALYMRLYQSLSLSVPPSTCACRHPHTAVLRHTGDGRMIERIRADFSTAPQTPPLVESGQPFVLPLDNHPNTLIVCASQDQSTLLQGYLSIYLTKLVWIRDRLVVGELFTQ